MKAFLQDNKTKHEINEVFQLQKKQAWTKNFITVTSNTLVSEMLKVGGHEYC